MSRTTDWIIDLQEYLFVLDLHNEGLAKREDVVAVVTDLESKGVPLPNDAFIREYKNADQ